jgi:7 transmembrane receptor (rhodopsin family)
LFIFCQNLGINASSLSLVAFTVERYVAICHPMRAHAVCTVNRAKRITSGVWVFALVYCSPWLGLTETKPLLYHGQPAARFCDFKRPRKEYLAYFFADLIVFYVVPLLVSCILYCLIARVLFARRMLSGAIATGGAPGRRKTKLNNSVSVVVDNSMASSARAQVSHYSIGQLRRLTIF